MKNIKNTLREISKYPSAIFGAFIILILIAVALFAVFTIPYDEAIRLWRGGEDSVYRNPKNVPPSWFNNFTDKDLPISIAVVAGEDEDFSKVVNPGESGSAIEYEYTFDYQYDDYPQELFLYIQADYQVKNPFISVVLETPGDKEIKISDFGTSNKQTYRFSQDDRLITRLRRIHGKELPVMQGLFSVPGSEPLEINKGLYTLKILASTFEPDSDVRIEFVNHGLVSGLFGTDHMRRDLTTAILWGAPIALAFGLLAAASTSVLSMLIAAIGAWFGGWVDELIQRITEVNLVLPFLSILIMVGTFYSRSIWVILGVTIALSIFTGAIKTNRAIFLQVKESTYIEAARAYGASNSRIIVRYLVPRIIPLLIPGLVSAVPSYVFLEASLALLGLGDPTLPTWGKVINDAYSNGALYRGQFYWILEPAILLMITGLGFAMLGFALDRIFNPRLRGM